MGHTAVITGPETGRPASGHAMTPEERCHRLRAILPPLGSFRRDAPAGASSPAWRVAPEPLWVDRGIAQQLEVLGSWLAAFMRAVDRLYLDSVRGLAPDWIHAYLDRGKPDGVVQFGRMRRFRDDSPRVLRPDLLLTEEGLVLTEVDPVPGGIGLTAALTAAYRQVGCAVPDAWGRLVPLFGQMVRAASGLPDPFVAMVVSDESADYRAEMVWLAWALRTHGVEAEVFHPRELVFTERGLFAAPAATRRIDVLYRFFELFDLPNVPKAELMLYSAKKRTVVLTPPVKAHLEEKLALALFHHPALETLWRELMGEEAVEGLRGIIPPTWIMDPRPIPPHAVVPGLVVGGGPVQSWQALEGLTQPERELVIKVSGFSPRAWGARGVVIGHDLPQAAWARAVRGALDGFAETPSVLQRFAKATRVTVAAQDPVSGEVRPMEGRVRLTPYYLIGAGAPELAGVLATVCPASHKVIHGKPDAVLVPCGPRGGTSGAASPRAGQGEE